MADPRTYGSGPTLATEDGLRAARAIIARYLVADTLGEWFALADAIAEYRRPGEAATIWRAIRDRAPVQCLRCNGRLLFYEAPFRWRCASPAADRLFGRSTAMALRVGVELPPRT